MYYKIALGNVKKSFKDYTIYFLTLTLAVCIFYSFNSIESQRAILDLSKSKSENLKSMLQIISYISVFVSVVLGCLIVYANNFLIKKRKKELGIYMTLGMGKDKISRILTIETMLVGAISLISGLLLGIIVSQGLSIFTSKLFEVSMTEFRFIISPSAISKTVFYFGVIFILVMILNKFTISKYKIIDLLNSSKKNEDIKIKNTFIYVILFILGAVCLGYAYKLILENGILLNATFTLCLALGIVGTFLIFFSLSGFMLSIVKKFKNIYFKDLNIFIIKQLNSKVNTNFMSMSVICLMLFLTIVMLSTGLSLKDALEKGVEETTPFDATVTVYSPKNENSVKETLGNIGVEFNNNEKYTYYSEYYIDNTVQEGFKPYVDKSVEKELVKKPNYRITFIKLSQYNQIMKLQNKETIDLKENEVLLTSNFGDMTKVLNRILKNNDKFNIGNETYIIKNSNVIEDSTRTTGLADNIFTLVVNDNVINKVGAKLDANYLDINYNENNKEISEEKFSTLFKDFYEGKYSTEDTEFLIGYTKKQIYEGNKGMSTIMVFIGIYLGIVFLISSMAVLSLQQLSEASDSVDRYKSLKRIGANDAMINRSIFIQTLVYFSLPLILAFIHSVVAVKVISTFISVFGAIDIGVSSIITAMIFVVVYIGYFYATYSGYKNIIKNL